MWLISILSIQNLIGSTNSRLSATLAPGSSGSFGKRGGVFWRGYKLRDPGRGAAVHPCAPTLWSDL